MNFAQKIYNAINSLTIVMTEVIEKSQKFPIFSLFLGNFLLTFGFSCHKFCFFLA